MDYKQLTRTTAILLLFSGLMTATVTLASENDKATVGQAVDGFYAALNAMFRGELEPMKKVWSHADDVTYMGPTGGFQVGWDSVEKNWAAQAAMKLGGEVHAKDVKITMGRDLAVVSNYEVGENVGADGETIEVVIRATSLFRKEDGTWKMIGHHTDLLPDLQK